MRMSAHLPKHGHVEEHRGEKDGERNDRLDHVLDVPEEQARGREKDPQADAEQGKQEHEDRYPDELDD